MTDEPLVLGIETSCDETGIGVVRGHTLLADSVASSVEEHARFGGVVPEVASRAHLEAMVPTIERACETAGIRLHDVDAIAVTSRWGPRSTTRRVRRSTRWPVCSECPSRVAPTSTGAPATARSPSTSRAA